MDDGKRASARREQREGCKRLARRHKVFEPATMKSASGKYRVHLLDVSATGALMHLNDPPALGSMVTILLGSAPTAATVVWRRGTRFGVTFAKLLDACVINDLLAAHLFRVDGVRHPLQPSARTDARA